MRSVFHRWSPCLIAACVLSSQVSAYGQAASKKAAAADARTFTPATEGQVDVAIRRAGAFLINRLPTQAEGYSSVMAMSLLKAGHKSDEPVIRQALDKILATVKGGTYKPLNAHLHIYEAGTAIMALGSADAKKYKAEIEAIAQYIISQQGHEGQWDYNAGFLKGTGDTSICQYAILGLWEATRAGVTVPGATWDRAAAWHIKNQVGNGGFCYHPNDMNPQYPEFRVATHTMTLAGICNLQIIRLHLYPNARDLEAEAQTRRKRGVKWGVLEPLQIEDDDPDMGANVARQETYTPNVRLATINDSLAGATRWITKAYAPAPPAPWQLYYLYALERMATLTGMDEIAGHDWYSEGTAYLVANQSADGSWADMSGGDAGTALAALFLGRATIKMLRHRPRPRIGTGILKGGRDLPENLDNLTAEKGDLKIKKMTGTIDAMLVELEKLDSINIESAQAALEDLTILKDPAALLKQRDRLLKLAKDPRANARTSAFTVLGKTDDIRVAPILIEAIASDPDPDCVIAAHKSLKFLSRMLRLGEKPDDLEFTEDAPPTRRAEIVKFWKNWYRVSRPYVERDGLPPNPHPAATGRIGAS